MEEYSIWKKIFDTDDDIEIEKLIKLVVFDEDARDLVFEKILYLRNMPKEMISININIDKELYGFPFDKLIKQISNDIMNQLTKKEVI